MQVQSKDVADDGSRLFTKIEWRYNTLDIQGWEPPGFHCYFARSQSGILGANTIPPILNAILPIHVSLIQEWQYYYRV